MTRSIITLPPDIENDAFDVYINGVLQDPTTDYYVDRHHIIFDRTLHTDHISGWRWLLGSIGIGTYRQDDTVDIRYEVDGQTRLKHALPITLDQDPY